MLALDRAPISPSGIDQEHFVAVCRGRAEPASRLEHIWAKYLDHVRCAAANVAKKSKHTPEGMIAWLEERAAWLYSRELELIGSFSEQLRNGRNSSRRQLAALVTMPDRVKSRQTAKTVSGGAPSTGKKR
jgi:hypothetical protein